jgi:hypothetical protein
MVVMRGAVSLRAQALLFAAGILASCDPADPGHADADADADTPAEADLEAGRDVEPDAGRPPEPGPITLVVDERGVTAERLCDVDGDGTLDNALANLGSPTAELAASAVTSALQSTIFQQGVRTVLHFPWVDDVGVPDDPDTVGMAFGGRDTDVPQDRDDDFSGEEPFYAIWSDLDGCGEPLFFTDRARIADGELDAHLAYYTFEGVAFRDGVGCSGTLAAGGASARFSLCSYGSPADLGAATFDTWTWLEVLVGGGRLFGLPTIPGVTPDIDVDGDGLERFILGPDGRIAACLDGDGYTTIDGADCWQDPRIADGFSITIVLHAVRARFAGPEPGWEQKVDGGCDEPPAESLWNFR